ncbi:MAG: NAD+ synthase [Gallionella sp.]
MKIALAQMNCVLGDLAANAAQILHYAEQAQAQGASLLLTPELSLCGYPPEDLLLREGFYVATTQALQDLAQQLPSIAVLVGHAHEIDGQHYNAASLLRDGKIELTYCKHALPNYAVFDEQRYFSAGKDAEVFTLNGVCFGINICADVWEEEAARSAAAAGAQVLLVMNASPFAISKQQRRYTVVRERVVENKVAVLYVNLVGGQDELVFDGGSFAMNNSGELVAQAAQFQTGLTVLDIAPDGTPSGAMIPLLEQHASIYQALCLGVKDYVHKNGFPSVLLGLSGGIDSALTLAIAVDALGADKVHAVMMPSPYTADISLVDSREMVKILGVRYDELSINETFATYLATLAPSFAACAADTTEENLQARIRGTLLMALSNKFGGLVLTTGNKSEMSVGYATLYGDMAGGLAVLKDICKTLVYDLSRYRNAQGLVIPERIITRPPSAELRPDQTDQDSLPPYAILDGIVSLYMEQDKSILDIIAAGYAAADVRRVVRLIRLSEYKRRQSAVGIRITERGYGKDWRYPITVRYQDEF